MGLIRFFSTIILFGACMAPVVYADEANFQVYADGAMKVYFLFQEPSKHESEQFYSFIKNKWDQDSCVKETCALNGEQAAKEYAKINRVKLENEIQ